jgi:hypothetical protein
VARQYVPDAGDIVWLNFTPHAWTKTGRPPDRSRLESSRLQQQNKPDALLSHDDADQALSF